MHLLTCVTICDKCDHMWQVSLQCDKCHHMWQVSSHVTSATTRKMCGHLLQVWPYLTSVTTCDKYDHIFLRNKDKLYIMTIWQIQSLSDPRADYLIRYTFQSQFPILVNSNQAWSKHEQTCSNLLTSCLKYLVSDIHQKKNYSLKNCIPYRDLFIPSPRPIELEGNMDARSAATKADWVSKSDVSPNLVQQIRLWCFNYLECTLQC